MNELESDSAGREEKTSVVVRSNSIIRGLQRKDKGDRNE